MTNVVSSCEGHKKLSDIVFDYRTIVMVILDKAVQADRSVLKIACRMDRLRLPFTAELVDAVLRSVNCPCNDAARVSNRTRTRTLTATRHPSAKLCKVKLLLSSMRTSYERLCAQS
ncbi:hypothetical protein CRUP_024555 [Coryphaenoides rupestris]|nr:hypothetical protein CRUP_024555 [Coryphaenoides rupestris]